MTGYELQYGDAGEVERHDKNLRSPRWKTFTETVTAKEMLEALVEALNNEDISESETFFRIIKNGEVVNL